MEAIRWLKGNLDESGRETQRILVLADGDFSVAELRAALPEGVVLMSRCAKNRSLYFLPEGPTERGHNNKRRGRPRKYGDRAKRPEEWLAKRGAWHNSELLVRGRRVPARFRVEGPYVVKKAAGRPVFLIVVKGIDRVRSGRRRTRKPAYWLVSALLGEDGGWKLPYQAEDLLSWAWQRWEVEVCHREMKSGFGLGEVQCWGPRSAILSVRWGVWCYGVMVLAGYRAWGLGRGPASLRPAGRWWADRRGGLWGHCGAAIAPRRGELVNLGPSSRRAGEGGRKRRYFWRGRATPWPGRSADSAVPTLRRLL